MEKFIARILILNKVESEIAYLYNRESFDLLNVDKITWDKSQFLEIGKIITYDEKKYRIFDINFKFNSEMSEIDNSLGINNNSPTELSNYNCQIGVFVEAIN